MTRRVYLYAFDSLFKIVDCKFLQDKAITVTNMAQLAGWMAGRIPADLRVYAVDNRPGLYADFREATKTCDFTKQLEFADMISYEGIRLK